MDPRPYEPDPRYPAIGGEVLLGWAAALLERVLVRFPDEPTAIEQQGLIELRLGHWVAARARCHWPGPAAACLTCSAGWMV